MNNWKTTTTGILAILITVSSAAHSYLTTGSIPDLSMVFASVLAGWGLIVAKDAPVRP
jgi:hypothetical protein